MTGVGYSYFRKYGDVYRGLSSGEAKDKIEDETDMVAHNAEVAIGYSTIPAYQRGSFAAPAELRLTYVNQLASKHMPISDLVQLDFNLFF